MTETPPEPPSRALGCLRTGLKIVGAGVLALVVLIGAWLLWRALHDPDAAARREAKEQLDPLLEQAENAMTEAEVEPRYDLDKTIRTIHQLDLAMAHRDDFGDYMFYVAQQDYRGVAPEVLEARKKLLDILVRRHVNQVTADQPQGLWGMTSDFVLSALSVVDVGVEMDSEALGIGMPKGRFSVDREQARQLLGDLRERYKERKAQRRELAALERELFGALLDYADVYYRYVEEWDALCLRRDHAYLAAEAGDWPTVLAAADAALAAVPDDREAVILRARALLELEPPATVEAKPEVRELLDGYLEKHPDSTAPALLLLGNFHRAAGDTVAAERFYRQAAAYYPKQAAQLTDMLDPYRMRGFLRKTREGSFIVEQYRATMQGAGYFSPDLQMARMYFAAGDAEAGRRKVLEHFARRRTQQSWDFVISDVDFCYGLMGLDFEQIFPRDAYLDLVVEPAMMSATRLSVAIRNRSGLALRNCTLLLCLNLTDMYPNDYETLVVNKSLPVLPPRETTDFGKLDVDLEVFGQRKTAADIVWARAILISNDAVIWVDTDKYKIAQVVAEARRQHLPAAAPVPEAEARTELGEAVGAVMSAIGKDSVQITVPAELAILKPVFRLRLNDRVFTPDTHEIQDDKIVLRFKNTLNFDAEDTDPRENRFGLEMATRYFTIDLGLRADPEGRLEPAGE